MPLLSILAWVFVSQTPPTDISTLTLKPATVIELDLGQMKGELRQIGWSPDGLQLYLQTAEGDPPNEKLHHFLVASDGGPLVKSDRQPEWAQQYWAFKSDRTAPGTPTLEIDAKLARETTRVGTGSARPGALATGRADDFNENAAMAGEGQRGATWTFTLLNETISTFKNTRPLPGLTFSWGPPRSGTIAFTDDEGKLVFLDQSGHKVVTPNVKDAVLPAWSEDGTRIAYAVKQGRKKYQLVWCTITR